MRTLTRSVYDALEATDKARRAVAYCGGSQWAADLATRTFVNYAQDVLDPRRADANGLLEMVTDYPDRPLMECLSSMGYVIPVEPAIHSGVDLDILAWDISDAIAKTADDHGLDFGMDEIKAALPAFLAAVAANAKE